MATITTEDGTQIYYKDWGSKSAQPLVFHHGWPLSADDWDAQMLYFVAKGYRVVAHDRRGHGRSSQVSDGHDMDHYAADADAVVKHLDLRNAVHLGHSTGGGEAARYVARHGKGRVAKLVLIAAVPPLVVKTAANPGGLPLEVFDGLRQQLAANRAQFYLDFASGPFYGFNRPGTKPSQGVIQNWWRQAMMGGAKPQYDGIKAFSETDFTEDLKAIDVPTLVMHDARRRGQSRCAGLRPRLRRRQEVVLAHSRARENSRRSRSMFHAFTGWKISVESTDTEGSYVIVPGPQVDALCRLLTEHCIPHAVEGEVPTRHHAESPAEPVVRLGVAAEATHVQDILDLAP